VRSLCRARRGDERGLTLIEFEIAAAVAVVMFMVLYSILNQAFAAYDIGRLRSRAVQHGRVAMVRMVDDIKYADDIYVADDDRILITRPKEGDGVPEDIDYRYNAASEEITRRINSGITYTFSEQVATFSLTFRDAAFNTLTTPVVDVQEIRYVEVELRVEEDNYVITLRNLVFLENSVTAP